ncbi:esterase-like activity of phytase family protein [Sphingomonas sp.]|uniref:esterase-like activity of phytase family protein n=1 Tax=Sphingomonas sp. TaxID=28214 RepID=UPI001B1DD7D0|nr:esterase-like activity of phytase family protein [Sphingomonas sp.]MBO9713145.1 esterase-like activity of phytase family protein [Sphingomonas sp.]
MRPLLPLLFVVALGIPASNQSARPVLGPTPDMRATRVALFPRDPARARVDALTYLGGVRLSSRDEAFGGFSSMLVRGDRFTLLSDSGNLVSFRMGADFRPFDTVFADLPAGPALGWTKSDRDSESMTQDPASGRIWVGFENYNAIWRFDAGLTRGEASVRPRPMRLWDVNGGPEAMTRLTDGRFVILSETTLAKKIPGNKALVFSRDPTDPRSKFTRFAFVPPAGGFAPSDMTQLPDGRLLVLVRRISINRWFESKLVVLDPAHIRANTAIRGREIAAFTVPMTRDNFEAIAVTREGSDTILWIASDDNRELVQQSLLMKFRIDSLP